MRTARGVVGDGDEAPAVSGSGGCKGHTDGASAASNNGCTAIIGLCEVTTGQDAGKRQSSVARIGQTDVLRGGCCSGGLAGERQIVRTEYHCGPVLQTRAGQIHMIRAGGSVTGESERAGSRAGSCWFEGEGEAASITRYEWADTIVASDGEVAGGGWCAESQISGSGVGQGYRLLCAGNAEVHGTEGNVTWIKIDDREWIHSGAIERNGARASAGAVRNCQGAGS